MISDKCIPVSSDPDDPSEHRIWGGCVVAAHNVESLRQGFLCANLLGSSRRHICIATRLKESRNHIRVE